MTQAIAAAAMFALVIAACTTTADTDIRVGAAPDTDVKPGVALDTDIITEIPPVTDDNAETAPDIDALLEAAADTDAILEPQTNTPVISPTNACGASDYQSLVGTNIAALTLPAGLKHRVIRPGDAYTGDYVPSRFNIFVDEDGVVIEVSCG